MIKMEIIVARYGNDLNLKATELRLGLPGIDEQCEKQHPLSSVKSKKRTFSDREDDDCGSKNNSGISDARDSDQEVAPATKQQIVGWPPVRSYRKNSFSLKKNETNTKTSGIYVKVSIDGAPYLRKIDLKVYSGYKELLKGLEDMFKCTMGHYFEREGYNRSEYEPTYQDKDEDWMLVGDVPWDMFISSCKRLRIMKASESRVSGSAGL